MRTPHIVGIGGTTRANSSTEKALRYTLRVAEEMGATTRAFLGADLSQLPHYAPEKPDRTDLARELVEEIRRADGLIVASPGYHGSVSGMVKNALDYTEDLREDPEPYLSGKAVGIIATGAGWQGIVTTIEAIRAIVHALRGWPTPLGAAINSTLPCFDADGEPEDDKVKFSVTTVAEEVMKFARWRLDTAQPATAK
ncbi:MAG: NAD(P)H-dependent oxidoreductase [Actinomycetota bacterium]